MRNSPYLRRADQHHNDWSDTVHSQANARGDGSAFAHATLHQYDILGNRVGSTLPDLGAAGTLNLLTYGSGHVHALQLGGHTVIDFERDPLHQETERSFAGLTLTRELDPVGRLLNQRQEGQATRAADYLTAAYRYNGSGQLIEVERSASIDASTGIATALYPEPQLTQYQYDRAERLSATVRIGNTSSVQRHQFDGAGNRLPALIPEHHLAQRQAASKQDTEKRSTDWSDTVQASLSDRNFNVLQNESSLGRGQREPIAQWRDNRVHYDGVYSYQHDGAGNRIKRTHIDGTTDTYGYDGDHRLVHHCGMNETGQISHTTENDYDPLGRRICKRVTLHTTNPTNTTNATQITHFGWDGDRLVYVETEHHKTHTVYEPGSFVPLLRITQATHDKTSQAKQAKTDAMQLMGLTDDDNSDAGTADKKIADSTDTTDWQAMNAGLASASQSPLPELAKQILRDMGMNPDDVHRDLKKQVKQQKAKTRESLTLHLYHCNHLGTPVALINEHGHIDWAIELDAWGNTVHEYHANPNQPIEQPIRMQGQQLDPESGLFYNRHRFYDPQLGRYLNQDPIGLSGGMNLFSYPLNPLQSIDPMGLEEKPGVLTRLWSWCTNGNDIKEAVEARENGRQTGLAACKAQKAMDDLKNLDDDPAKALKQLEDISQRRGDAIKDATKRLGKQTVDFGKDAIPSGKPELKNYAKTVAFGEGVNSGMKEGGCK